MNRTEARYAEIYIGSPPQHESERTVLYSLVRLLEGEQSSAIIFANISLASHQIDFIVALDGQALVIESKGYTRPVRGGENGPWQVQVASGDWKDFQRPGNPYVQARDAALAVKDAMRSFAGADVPYPAAAVIFVPRIPHGSKV